MDYLIVLTMDTRRDDVPDWDFLNYINFIVATEAEFGVKFKIADIDHSPMSADRDRDLEGQGVAGLVVRSRRKHPMRSGKSVQSV